MADKVLVVEDDRQTSELLVARLETAGYDVISTPRGDRAIQMAIYDGLSGDVAADHDSAGHKKPGTRPGWFGVGSMREVVTPRSALSRTPRVLRQSRTASTQHPVAPK